MSNFDKVASVCADVYLKKTAGARESLSLMEAGDAARKAIQANNKAIAGGGMDNWMKILLGIGGGKLLLDSQGQSGKDWRR